MGELLDWITDQCRRTGKAAHEAMDANGQDIGLRVDARLAAQTKHGERGFTDRVAEDAFARTFGQSAFDDNYDKKP